MIYKCSCLLHSSRKHIEIVYEIILSSYDGKFMSVINYIKSNSTFYYFFHYSKFKELLAFKAGSSRYTVGKSRMCVSYLHNLQEKCFYDTIC